MSAAEKPAVKRPRVRYSMKLLLLAPLLLALLLYWWDTPRRTARRFAATINRGDYAAAEAMLLPPSNDLMKEWLIHKKISNIEMTADVPYFYWESFVKRHVDVVVEAKIDSSEYLLVCAVTHNGIMIDSCLHLTDDGTILVPIK